MKQKFKLPTTDRLIGVSAIIISLLTLIIFIYQTHIISTESRLSVKPNLFFDFELIENDSLVSFKRTVKNKGLGPALIHSSVLRYQNEDYTLDFDKFISDKFPDVRNYTELDSYGITEGSIISPDETITIYKFEINTNNPKAYREFWKCLNFEYEKYAPDWSFELIYSSIYEDEKWCKNTDETKLKP